MPEIRTGQVWRRKNDGRETVIVSTSMGAGVRPTIRHRIGHKLWDTDRAAFLEKYELDEEAPNE